MFEPYMQLTMVLVAEDESHIEFVCVVARVFNKGHVPQMDIILSSPTPCKTCNIQIVQGN
jgi:hypothetical protein